MVQDCFGIVIPVMSQGNFDRLPAGNSCSISASFSTPDNAESFLLPLPKDHAPLHRPGRGNGLHDGTERLSHSFCTKASSRSALPPDAVLNMVRTKQIPALPAVLIPSASPHGIRPPESATITASPERSSCSHIISCSLTCPTVAILFSVTNYTIRNFTLCNLCFSRYSAHRGKASIGFFNPPSAALATSRSLLPARSLSSCMPPFLACKH